MMKLPVLITTLVKVVKKLKEKGEYENTVIIIMADNGRPFPHSKTRVNNQGVKTPFIVHYPKIKSKKFIM